MPAPSYWPLPPPAAPAALGGPLSPPLGPAEFLAAWQLYLPQGRAWRAKDDPQSVMYGLLSALAERQAAAYARETNLFAEIDPASTVELVPEWQASLGLPDPCMPPDPPLALEQAQILSRFQAFGGQSIGYFEGVAQTLGASVTITELSDGRVNETACCEMWGAPGLGAVEAFAVDDGTCCTPLTSWDAAVAGCDVQPLAMDWDFTLLVTVTQPYSYEWAVGDSTVSDPLTDFSQNPLASQSEFAVGDSTCCTPLAWWGDSLVECELRRILPGQCAVIFAYAPG